MRSHLYAIQSGVPAKPSADGILNADFHQRDSLTLDRLSSGSLSFTGSSRSSSLGSDILETSRSVLDIEDFESSEGTTPTERWRRSLKLVQKGLAFSQAFKTLRDMSGENTIDPARLTKIKEIGVGAFATVDVCWLANSAPDIPPCQVAVKRLRYEALKHRSDLKRFFKEAAILRRLRHRSIAGYIGVGNFSEEAMSASTHTLAAAEAKSILKSTFIVQEYIPGGSLKDIIIRAMTSRGRQTYSDSEAAAWMRQLAEGLLYLHTSSPKVMHRDLKLDNILMRDSPGSKREACLADFGISVLLPSKQQKEASKPSCTLRRKSSAMSPRALTRNTSLPIGSTEWQELSEQVEVTLERTDTAMAQEWNPQDAVEAKTFDLTGKCGSFMYMAPEVYSARQYNEKADVFSFGCLLHEVFARLVLSTLVVGPTGNPQAAKIYAHKVANGYRWPLPKTFPLELKELVSQCWAQEASERPDMDIVLRRLEEMEDSMIFAGRSNGNEKPAFASCTGCCIM